MDLTSSMTILELAGEVSTQLADVLSASGVRADVVVVIDPADANVAVAASMTSMDERRATNEVKDVLERAYETVLDGGPVISKLSMVRHGPSE